MDFLGISHENPLISYCNYTSDDAGVSYSVLHQRLVFLGFSSTCHGSVLQTIYSFAFVADDRLSVSCPFQRIVVSAILQDAVEALSVPSHVSVKIGLTHDEAVLRGILQVVSRSKIAIVGIILLGSRENDGLGLVLSVVGSGVEVPCSVHLLGAYHRIASCSLKCILDGAAGVVDGSEDELAGIACADAVVGIA